MVRSIALFAAATLLGICGAGLAHAGPAFAQDRVTGKAVELTVSNELYEFTYLIPAEASAIPALRAILEKRAGAAEADVNEQANEMKAAAFENGYPFRPHYLSVAWDVAADLPGWLSLSAAVESYSGGAYGNHGFDAVLWDKAAERLRDPDSLFVSRERLREAVQPAFCEALNREREERRGEPVPQGGDNDIFDACIDPLESTVVLASSKGEAFDEIMVLIAPYLAGPYVEGSYVIALPVTGAVLAAVRPEFRDAFAAVP